MGSGVFYIWNIKRRRNPIRYLKFRFNYKSGLHFKCRPAIYVYVYLKFRFRISTTTWSRSIFCCPRSVGPPKLTRVSPLSWLISHTSRGRDVRLSSPIVSNYSAPAEFQRSSCWLRANKYPCPSDLLSGSANPVTLLPVPYCTWTTFLASCPGAAAGASLASSRRRRRCRRHFFSSSSPPLSSPPLPTASLASYFSLLYSLFIDTYCIERLY